MAWKRCFQKFFKRGNFIKAGMSKVLSVIVAAFVLLMLGVIMMFISGSGLNEFLPTLEDASDRSVCLSKKEIYCSSHPQGLWVSSEAKAGGGKCEEILEKPAYDCSEDEWDSCEDLCKRYEKTKDPDPLEIRKIYCKKADCASSSCKIDCDSVTGGG